MRTSAIILLAALCALAAKPIYRISLSGTSSGGSASIATTGDWTGFAATATVTSLTQTLTGTGTVTLAIVHAGAGTMQYQVNAGAWTTFVNGGTLAVTNGTLTFRILSANAGSSALGTVNDSLARVIGNVDVENTL